MEISRQIIWLNSTGMDRADVIIRKYGPFYRVSEEWSTGGAGKSSYWHYKEAWAEHEYTKRIIEIRNYRNKEDV